MRRQFKLVSLGITWSCCPWRLLNAPRARASVGESGCGLALQDRDRKGSTHMALSLPVATGTTGTEWLFHGAVGGRPIGWDPPYSSQSSVGPLLPGSFHCLSRTGKFRHVAPGCASPGCLPPWTTVVVPPHDSSCHLYGDGVATSLPP